MKYIKKTLSSASASESLGAIIGSRLVGGECFELISDLGGGKTTFTRGLVAGSGSNDMVSSPTFTIGKQYTSDKLHFYHFDFYRLQEPGLVAEELQESLQDPMAVIIVEWADTVRDVLPSERVVIELLVSETSAESRDITIHYPDKYNYVMKDVL